MELRAICVILLIGFLAVSSQAAKNKKGKKGGSDCTWGPCTPNSKDCGEGTRERTCKEETQKEKCNIPCNWKKPFGADCKYKFGKWSECDSTTGQKTGTGTLKKALHNAECQQSVEATKPCSPKIKSRSKGKKGKRRIEEQRGFA
ncbi:hypothetical protein GDO86_018851, partial [Hymenochirus boettgeri]